MIEGHSAHRTEIRAEPGALPLRLGSVGAAWVGDTLVGTAAGRLPLALANLHHALAVGAPLGLLVGGLAPGGGLSPADLLSGAGFADIGASPAGDGEWITARRAPTLPDFVGPGLRLLVCGLNPSLVAAAAGFGYAGATNRFWGVAVSAGLVSMPRDPWRALGVDRVGMTDMVKRATPRAGELSRAEYSEGAARVARLVRWLRPAAVCFVGLQGWRAAVDRHAVAGWQEGGFGGAPAYVMPSTSGLNARTTPAELAGHLRAALDGERGPSRT